MNVKDSGSNYSFYNGSPKANNLPRSVFDLSHINTTTARLGIRYPVWTQHTLPKEDYKVDVEAVARVVNPPVVPLMSKQRIFFHTYWMSYHQLWKQAQLFFDKGRNKKQYKESSSISIPTIKLTSWKRGSLADFLGFNCAKSFTKDDNKTLTVPALKFMAYLRIWRDCYLNQRIYSAWLLSMTSDTSKTEEWRQAYQIVYDFLFPVDDADFRIGSTQWEALIGNSLAFDYVLTTLKYADFADDYFTRAQLSPMYVDNDDVPTIDFGSAVGSVATSLGLADKSFFKSYPNGYNLNLKDVSSDGYHILGGPVAVVPNDATFADSAEFKRNLATGGSPEIFNAKFSDTSIWQNPISGVSFPQFGLGGSGDSNSLPLSGSAQQSYVDAFNNTFKVNVNIKDLASSITIDAIRKCESATLILEKMAKTDGSYAQYAKAFFGERPKSAYDFRPTYVGGSYQSVVYSQVLNTTSDNQGKVTGIGISSGSGNIGRFHSDDYGLFVTIMTITPDTYYCQGLNREDTYEVAEDFYLPERAQLGMQGVLEKEIYNQTDDKEDDNNKLFGYQNIYDELRYRANEVHGDVADVESASGSVGASFSPYIQTRYFKSAPTLTPSFLTMEDNINNSWLSAKDEPPFIVQIANKVQAVRPVPYRAKPATFGM